ncbi:AAA family ATPase [Halobacteria archaeon AArc-curdl1]|uniref:AAA family ATPase n=1 Tax=Natronosalvus hydrolyticus TaxID=2979988 RepID=A0AAP2Z831_9EURY|nr:AAA family ATPase [Halobacteria archaeon AArc-curdl1]
MTDANPSPPTEATSRADTVEPLPVSTVADLAATVTENVGQVIVGHTDEIEHVVTTILARGHVLLDDVPGVGKTMLARSIARSVDCSFRRVQFTPDLLPSDITGVNVFNQKTREFEFQPGPVFANLVLGDEINRAPPKTQSALLEAMEEAQVTVDGTTRPLPDPFVVIATQNAIEPNRTYELPFAEVDRFMKKLSLGYPNTDEESELLARTVGHHPIESLDPVTNLESIIRARETVATVAVEEPVRRYASKLAKYTRERAHIGASPRGTIALLRAAQARAVLDGREYVIPDDIQHEVPYVFSHRIKTTSSGRDTDGDTIVEDALDHVHVP